jgi:hypothetical protein
MSEAFRHHALTVAGLCAIAVLVAIKPARAEVTKPSCEATEPWALAIDPKDRWNPNPAQKKFWLPSQFQGAEFEGLFGLPVTEWTLDDVNAIRPLLQRCAKAASRAKRFDAQKAFNAARAFVSGNLKNHIVQRARAGANLDKNLDALLDLPDSPHLLQVLAVLRDLKAGDKNALGTSQRRIAQFGGAEAKAARQIVTAAYRQTPEKFAADTLPRLDERYQDLRTLYIEQAEDRLAEHPSGPTGLAGVDAALTAVRDELGVGLAPQDYARLDAVAEDERTALRQEILDDAKARIDALAVAPASIDEAAAIVARTSPSLDDDANGALRSHAEARQHAVTEAVLANAETGLAGFPATLAGIGELDRHVADTVGIVAGHLDEGRIKSFRGAASGRRSEMAGEALPEFEALVAGLGNDPTGLEGLNAEAAKVEAWEGLDPDTRAAYQAAVTKRRTEMEVAIAAAAEQQENERQAMVVKATKARIDAMTPRFRSLEGIDAEVAAARGKGLDAAAMAEIETHAAARQQALADEILALAEPKLSEAPETFEAFGQLIDFIDTVVDETKGSASPAALERFEEAATEASTELGRKLLDGFEADLAALTEDRDGLEKARQATDWAEGWRLVEDDLRDDYIEAARGRRDEIAGKLAAAEAERRDRVLAAGGDPEVVGHTFADEEKISTIEFVDESRVIFAVLGMRFGGKYEIVKDDIFVEGPNGTVVFARDGDKLTGMGLTLERVAK